MNSLWNWLINTTVARVSIFTAFLTNSRRRSIRFRYPCIPYLTLGVSSDESALVFAFDFWAFTGRLVTEQS
jgi:hypothetical protein